MLLAALRLTALISAVLTYKTCATSYKKFKKVTREQKND